MLTSGPSLQTPAANFHRRRHYAGRPCKESRDYLAQRVCAATIATKNSAPRVPARSWAILNGPTPRHRCGGGAVALPLHEWMFEMVLSDERCNDCLNRFGHWQGFDEARRGLVE